MSFEASPHVGDERGVFRDLGRQRIDPARGVEELPFGAGDRPNADEDVADAEEAAQRLAIQGVLEVGRLGPGDQLVVRSLRDDDRRPVALHQRGGGEAQRLGARAEVFVELSGVRLEQQGAAADDPRRSVRRRATARDTGIRGRAGSPGWIR